MSRICRYFLYPLFAIFALVCISSCSSIKVDDYAKETPVLKLSEYFNGKTRAYGIFTDRGGKVVKRFTVDINSSWSMVNGVNTGILDESFVYSDGTTQKRIWTIKEVSPNHYEGTAADVVGKAHGRAAGNALNWTYTLLLPVDGKDIEVQFNDWMYLVNEKVMLNRAQMTKFGIYLGEVTLSFMKD